MSDCCTPPPAAEQPCCCGKPSFAVDSIETSAGSAWRVSTAWSPADKRGQWMARVSDSFRMKYRVDPGLYGVGRPSADSPVFVSANYKKSFDILRRELAGMDAWILVLDTKGINVWCAAGKGTFGTAEIVRRVQAVELGKVVNHRQLVVPQLGAPGVAAHEVKESTGFKVLYGPVYAHDIQAWVENGYTATAAMREVRFTLWDRFVLTPMELVPALRMFGWFAVVALLVAGLQPQGVLFAEAVQRGWRYLLLGLIAVAGGSFFVPILLPYIPFRAFTLKGAILGMLGVAAIHWGLPGAGNLSVFETGLIYLLFPAASSFLAFNFTGCTTFTNPTGVQRELRIAMPVYAVVCGVSIALVVGMKLEQWGLI